MDAEDVVKKGIDPTNALTLLQAGLDASNVEERVIERKTALEKSQKEEKHPQVNQQEDL